jgi:hypothetical protein
MIKQLIARKLLTFVLYSAAVTALPVLAAVPAARFIPALQAEHCCDGGSCASHCTTECADCVEDSTKPQVRDVASDPCDPWWCRGPVRRGVRALARFIARPWRR